MAGEKDNLTKAAVDITAGGIAIQTGALTAGALGAASGDPNVIRVAETASQGLGVLSAGLP